MRCKTCAEPYSPSEKLLGILRRVASHGLSIPPPPECPRCSRLRRQAWQNEKSLYHRTCDLSGKKIVSVYSPDKPFPVYGHEAWISDDWDAGSFAQPYDASRSFFEQFHELHRKVPRKAQNLVQCENCDFNNNLWSSKNAYLSFMSSYLVDCYYDYASWDVKNSIEVWYSKFIELSHTIISSENLYGCIECERCFHSNALRLCKRCSGCSHCFGCYGLKQKQFHIFNEPVGETEYHRFMREAAFGSWQANRDWRERAHAFFATLPQEAIVADDFSEDFTGNFVFRTVRSESCFVATDVEDCVDLFESARTKDCAGLDFSYTCTLCYDSASTIQSFQCAFLDNCSHCNESYYLSQCDNCTHCFGCVGLRRKSFCILNKQYSEAEYFPVRNAIVTALTSRGEWGSFFPIALSDFGYNETEAALNRPLRREDAASLGASWSEYQASSGAPQQEVLSADALPDHIADAGDDVLLRAWRCTRTARPYRIIAKELEFHRGYEIPLPRIHPLERYRDLVAHHGGTSLQSSRCTRCHTATHASTVAADSSQLCCFSCFRSWLAAQ